MRDAPIDNLIRKSLSAQTRRDPGPCMDENIMAAYLEESLSSEERNAVESHVADCAACQRVLALSMKLQPQVEKDRVFHANPASKRTLFRLSIPVPAIGALLVCIAVGAAFFLVRQRTQETAVREKQVAVLDSHAPLDDPQLGQNPFLSKAARSDSVVTEKGAPIAAAKDKRMATSAVQSAQTRLNEKLDSMETDRLAGRMKTNEAEIAAPTVAGAVAPASPQESSQAHAPAMRDEMAVPAPSVSTQQPMAALPAGLASRADGNLEAKKEKAETLAPPSQPPADAIVLARTQEPFVRPPLYAASNRIATSLYKTESVEASLRFAIKNLSSNLKSAESRKIGDKVFYKHLGYWIDGQCREHPEDAIVEVAPEDPVLLRIMEKYSDVRSLQPAAIFWESKIYLLR